MSVYSAIGDTQELQNVAALYQTAPTTVDKRFAVKISSEDCKAAGIHIRPTLGDTGVSFVDIRHADLEGSIDAFIDLCKITVEKIWLGENRLRTYAPHAILGELAVMSHLDKGIDAGARERCNQIIQLSMDNVDLGNVPAIIGIHGRMADKEELPVVARRRCARCITTSAYLDRVRLTLAGLLRLR